ncbi:helix-turn-helix domain-containing protein [Streptomyces vinaceus]|uniref:helix-turn-helix domain-containing protein n=1 Tax=Streptomyces vinaceus TaxID=1960 RepID=UPI00367EE26E
MRQRFGRLVAEAAQRAGKYQGRGGQAAFAADTGMSASAIGRMLRGETLPDPERFEAIAKAVDINVSDLLIEAGIVSPESLATQVQNKPPRVGSDSITLDEAANALGIRSAVGREMFAAAVERLQRTEREAEADDGGAAAHA